MDQGLGITCGGALSGSDQTIFRHQVESVLANVRDTKRRCVSPCELFPTIRVQADAATSLDSIAFSHSQPPSKVA
eukprot:1654564-Pleurochrysis_carterae.AAC.1